MDGKIIFYNFFYKSNFAFRVVFFAVIAMPVFYFLLNIQAVLADTSESKLSLEPSLMTVNKVTLDGFKSRPEPGVTEEVLNEYIAHILESFNYQLTFAQLQTIADQVNLKYQEAGYMFTRAIIPPQEIVDGRLVVKITEGILGQVVVHNNERYKPEIVAGSFLPLLHQRVYRHEIDAAVEVTKNLPGLDIFGYFSMGKEPGETRFNIKVLSEQDWKASLHGDNYGSKTVGENRLFADFSILNPTGWGDQLNFGILQSVASNNSTYGNIKYSRPIISSRDLLELRINSNRFSIGREFENLDLEGNGVSGQLAWNHRFTRVSSHTPWKSHLISVLGFSKSKISSGIVNNLLDGKEDVVFLAEKYLFERSDEEYSYLFDFGLRGGRVKKIGGIENDFLLLESSFTGSYFLGNLNEYFFHSISTNIGGQFSDKTLPSTNRYPLGGPFAVRSLSPGFISVDRGVLVSLEWNLLFAKAKNPFLRSLQTTIFMDYGFGQLDIPASSIDYGIEVVEIPASEQQAEFSAVGFGLNWQHKSWRAKYSWATSIGGRVSGASSFKNLSGQHFLSIDYLFKGR